MATVLVGRKTNKSESRLARVAAGKMVVVEEEAFRWERMGYLGNAT